MTHKVRQVDEFGVVKPTKVPVADDGRNLMRGLYALLGIVILAAAGLGITTPS